MVKYPFSFIFKNIQKQSVFTREIFTDSFADDVFNHVETMDVYDIFRSELDDSSWLKIAKAIYIPYHYRETIRQVRSLIDQNPDTFTEDMTLLKNIDACPKINNISFDMEKKLSKYIGLPPHISLRDGLYSKIYFFKYTEKDKESKKREFIIIDQRDHWERLKMIKQPATKRKLLYNRIQPSISLGDDAYAYAYVAEEHNREVRRRKNKNDYDNY